MLERIFSATTNLLIYFWIFYFIYRLSVYLGVNDFFVQFYQECGLYSFLLVVYVLFLLYCDFLVRMVSDFTVNRIRSIGKRRAEQMLRDCLQWDGYENDNEVRETLEALGPRIALIDLGPNLAWLGHELVKREGEGGGRLFAWLRSRLTSSPDHQPRYVLPIWKDVENLFLEGSFPDEFFIESFEEEDSVSRTSEKTRLNKTYSPEIYETKFYAEERWRQKEFLQSLQSKDAQEVRLGFLDKLKETCFTFHAEGSQFNSEQGVHFYNNIKSHHLYYLEEGFIFTSMEFLFGQNFAKIVDGILLAGNRIFLTSVYFELPAYTEFRGLKRGVRPIPQTSWWRKIKRHFTYGFTHGGTMPLHARNHAAELLMSRDLSWLEQKAA